MNRRTDTRLRKAISVIEKMLLTDPTTEMILVRVLQQLMLLLEGNFGFVYRCESSEKNGVPWEFVGSFSHDKGKLVEQKNSSTIDRVSDSMSNTLLAGRCIDSACSTEYDIPLPHISPDIENYFCVPIVDAKGIYAVVYVCNMQSPADPGLEKRIRPFIAASTCLLRAAEKKARTVESQKSLGQCFEGFGFLQGMLDTMFNGVLVIDEVDNIIKCNKAATAMLSAPVREIVGAKLSRFLPKGAPRLDHRLNYTDYENYVAQRTSSKTVWRGVPALKANGMKTLVDLSAFEVDVDSKPVRVLVMDDISERIKSASDHHATLQRFQVLTTLTPVGIIQLTRDWKCIYVNDKWCEYCQMTPEEARELGWMRGLHMNDADQVLAQLREGISQSGRYEGEFRLQSPLGKIVWVSASACGLYSDNGETTGMIISFNDITARLSNERRLQDIAEKDQLTGLVNRTFFNDRVDMALRGVGRFGSVALMFVDLDEFKHINDTLGHEAGDTLLQAVAGRLKDTLRQVDTIARIGGDEFTVLLTNVTSTPAITSIANKLLNALAAPFTVSDHPIYVSCSIGIAVAEKLGKTDTKQLLKQADIALYKAKEAGRNQYKFYTPELDKKANLHISLRHSLKAAERNDFRVVYQPQVDAQSGRVVGLEALTRWASPNKQAIGPAIFIKMIEESGMIDEFSSWLFESVFKTVKSWHLDSESKFTVSINLSAKQFRNPDLADSIHQLCVMHGISPSRIILEVTETALIDDSDIASKTLNRLRLFGFGVSLDDFGTGYYSLVYLRNMPLQSVKIDRSFIQDVIHDEENAKIVLAILTLAETLDLKVVAEGVDNTEVKEWLIENNCPIQQGYYFYQPLECDEIDKMLISEKLIDQNVVPIGVRLS